MSEMALLRDSAEGLKLAWQGSDPVPADWSLTRPLMLLTGQLAFGGGLPSLPAGATNVLCLGLH